MTHSRRRRIYRACLAVALMALLMAGAVSSASAITKTAPGGAAAAGGPVASATNTYLEIQVGADGRFNSGATGMVTGKAFGISYAWPSVPWSSYTTVRVDGVDWRYGGSGGTFTQVPTDVSPTTNRSVWRVGDIEVTQTLEIVTGSSTGRPDTGLYRYTLKNLGATAHNVGLRVMVDTYLEDNDACPFRVPGTGSVTTEMDFVGNAIPEYWQAFRDLSDLSVMAQGTLRGGLATRPDRFSITKWGGVSSSMWDYTTTPGLATGDSAVLMYWNPVAIQPGQVREIRTYYGLGTISGTTNPTLTGPVSLSLVDGLLSPNPFTVTGYVSNNTPIVLTNTPITLTLPPGLRFASGETATHVIPEVLPGQTGLTSWSVTAVGSGTMTYAVTALGTTAERSVFVPARPRVSLGTPVAPKTMKRSKSYTVYGSLKPKHTAGTKPVRIYKYKKVGKKWVKKGYVTAKAYNYKSYTRYKVKMKLTSRGSWRLRAYAPADSRHSATWSKKYDYVQVK